MSLIGAGLQAYLCVLLIVRAWHRQFRFFTLCMILAVASAVALIVVRNNAVFYWYIYWPSEALSMVFAFLAVQEAFYRVFKNFSSISWFRRLFPIIGIFMLLVAVVRAAFHPVSQAGLIGSALVSLEIAVGFLQFGIFFLFILLVRFFHMRWRQQAFGVVLGFGIAAAGSLIAYLLRSEFGTKIDPVVRFTPLIAYIIAVVVWLATFLRAQPTRQASDGYGTLTPEQMASDLRRYTRAVKGILER